MSPSLSFVRRVLLDFQDGRYDWTDGKEFIASPPHVVPQDALTMLLEHVRFRDTYMTGDSQGVDSVELHGPYWLQSLSPDLFEAAEAVDVDAGLRKFVSRYCTQDELIPRMGRYDNEVVPLLAGSTDWSHLPELPESAQHEFGWVLDDFTEYVTFDRSTGRLLLIVAAAD